MATYGSQYRSKYGSSSTGLGENKRSPLLDPRCWLERSHIESHIAGLQRSHIASCSGYFSHHSSDYTKDGMVWATSPPESHPISTLRNGTDFRGYTRPRGWDGVWLPDPVATRPC